MSEEIKPWSPDDAVNAMKERIRLEYIALVPPEQFAKMIQAEINQFMQSTANGYGYGSDTLRRSSFGAVVNEILRDRVTEEVKATFSAPDWNSSTHNPHWPTFGQMVSEQVQQIVKEQAPEMVKLVMQSTLQSVVDSIRQSFHR